jgi:hypothetical protein
MTSRTKTNKVCNRPIGAITVDVMDQKHPWFFIVSTIAAPRRKNPLRVVPITPWLAHLQCIFPTALHRTVFVTSVLRDETAGTINADSSSADVMFRATLARAEFGDRICSSFPWKKENATLHATLRRSFLRLSLKFLQTQMVAMNKFGSGISRRLSTTAATQWLFHRKDNTSWLKIG